MEEPRRLLRCSRCESTRRGGFEEDGDEVSGGGLSTSKPPVDGAGSLSPCSPGGLE